MKGGVKMYYEAHEIYGSELPIVRSKQKGQYTFDELFEQDLLDRDREEVAYLQVMVHGQKLYLKLYEIK